MNTAKKIKINYHTKAAYELASSQPCPCSVNDVYALGVNLQYCIRAKYNELNGLLPGRDNSYLSQQAAIQLNIKTEIEKQAKYKLNVLLGEFYEHGGPIMEDPISKQMAKDMQPFFNRHVSNLLSRLDELTRQAEQGRLKTEELTAPVEKQLTDTYTAMAVMFRNAEMESAFNDLIEIRQS